MEILEFIPALCPFYIDELVCTYQNCTDEVCDTLYEVCSEVPVLKNTTGHFICYSIFMVELDTLSYRPSRGCFVDQSSPCSEECIPELQDTNSGVDTALFFCCCVGNLCNNVTFNSTGLILCCLQGSAHQFLSGSMYCNGIDCSHIHFIRCPWKFIFLQQTFICLARLILLCARAFIQLLSLH